MYVHEYVYTSIGTDIYSIALSPVHVCMHPNPLHNMYCTYLFFLYVCVC